MQQFNQDSATFDYCWNRRKGRKYVSLKVEPSNLVVVQLPWRYPVRDIPRVLKKHLPWIQKQLQRNSKKGLYRPKSFSEGELFWYLGEEYVLKFQTHIMLRSTQLSRRPLMVRDREWWIDVDALWDQPQRGEYAAKKIIRYYRSRAIEVLTGRCLYYQDLIGVRAGNIVIRTAKSRWGSCSSQGEIMLNWKMMMAPIEIIDYVVIHELCHLLEHNHSPRFWKLVESYDPYYKQHKQWLSERGLFLDLF